MRAGEIEGSRRSQWPAPSDEHRELAATAIDLTCSNPTALGLLHPAELLDALSGAGGLRYTPDPLGLPSARAAVCAHHAARGIELDIDRVALCASTSEAYTQWMWLTADPGELWWVPQPGYPLLDALAQLTGVELRGYPLRFDGRWSIDLDALAEAVTREPRSRAVVVVAPGNPTGSYLARHELAALESLCERHRLTLVVDEVFAEHAIAVPPDRVRNVAGPLRCRTVVLSGLSKLAALPQLKLAWSVWHGPPELRAPLWDRLAHIADAQLSLATPVQLALPALLAAGAQLRPRIVARLHANLELARARLRSTAIDVLPVEGGWSVLLRLPVIGGRDDQRWTAELAREAGVAVQPGWLFDLPGPPRIVLSLITEPALFARGIAAIAEHVAGVLARPDPG